MSETSYFERWKRGEGAAALLKDADATVEHLKGELKRAVEDGHTMYQRGVNVGRQGAAGGRQL